MYDHGKFPKHLVHSTADFVQNT